MIELILPYPPSVNNYKTIGRIVITRSGKKYQQRVNSKETIAFYYEVWIKIRSLANIKRMDLPIEGDISMELYVYPPDARKRDIDNLAKVTCDSLVRGGLIQDDNQISRLLIERRDIIDQGKVIVRIKELV